MPAEIAFLKECYRVESKCRREHSDDGRTWWSDRSGDMVRSGEQFEQFGKMLCAQSQAYLANPRHFDGIKGGRQRVSDACIDKNRVSCT